MDAKLLVDELSQTTMRVATKSRLRVVLKACGFERRGGRNLRQIEKALEARSVYAHPPLTTPGLDWDCVVHFARTPWTGDSERHMRFPVEFHLNQFLVANFEVVFRELKLVKSEWEVASGKIDILAKDVDGYVVIELKKNTPSEDLVNKLGGYMADVATWAAAQRGPQAVRGLVVAGAHDKRMAEQLRAIADERGLTVDWMTYRVELTLEPTSP